MAVPDTLRGFRTQFLYTLYRVVTDNHPEYVYVPEGLEDLDIKKDDKVLEAIQVKNLNSSLTYGNLQSPGKKTSFFMRGNTLLTKNPTAILKVTSFGPIGNQLTDSKKLQKALHNDPKVPNDSIQSIVSSFVTENVNEDDLYDNIVATLKSEFPAFNGAWEIKHLLQWIYELAENQETLNLVQLRNQLLSFREVEARQASSQAQLGIRVKRLFKNEASELSNPSLKDEFLKGVSAQPAHIQVDADIRRLKWLTQIDYAFNSRNVLIVHGISGQGKSSLCYRYIKDYETFAFEICDCSTATLADINATIQEISSNLHTHVLIYFDVDPGEHSWTKLVKEFAGKPHIKILVSIREEDWQSSKYMINEFASYNEISLSLSKEEAYQIFKNYNPTPNKSVFIDKWEELGENAPLLEFIFSINHGETLKSKLANQYRNLSTIQQRVVASIIMPLYLGGVPTEKTITAIDGINPISIAVELSSLEGEYFIKEGTAYRDVHPLRTMILKEIICNGSIHLLITIGLYSLGRLPIKDCSRYIVHLFQEGMKLEELFRRLDEFETLTPSLCYEIVKSLLWKGCHNYVYENESLIGDLHNVIGGFWTWMLPINYTDIELDDSFQTIFQNSIGIYDSAREISNRMDRQDKVFCYVRQWFSNHSIKIDQLQRDEYACLGKLLYLLSLEGLTSYIDSGHLSVVPAETLDCEDYAYLLLGLKSSNIHSEEWSVLEQSFLQTFRKKYLVYSLVFRDDEIESKILIDIRNGFENKSIDSNTPPGATRFINKRVVTVCELLRMSYPNKNKYSCVLEAGNIGEIMIDRVKSISKRNLPIELMKMPRRMVCQIYENKHRPENKRLYFESTISARNQYLSCASSLNGIFKKWIKGESPSANTLIRFQTLLEAVRSMPIVELPASEFDPTYIQENDEKNTIRTHNVDVLNYSSTFDKYSSAISNFFIQFLDSLSSDAANRFPAKYNLLEAIKESRNLITLTSIFGNPYSNENEINRLLKQEEKILSKLWIYWNHISNHRRSKSTPERVEFEWKERQKSLSIRFTHDLKKSFERLGFITSVERDCRIVNVRLQYDNMQMYKLIPECICYAIKESLLELEYLSPEYVMLMQQIDSIRISEAFAYGSQEFCITGLTWFVSMNDCFMINESKNPQTFIRAEKYSLNADIPELYIPEMLQSVLWSMSVLSSQIHSAKNNKAEIDEGGNEIINQIEKNYNELSEDLFFQIENVRNIAESVDDTDVVKEINDVCDKMEKLCHDGQWLNYPDKIAQLSFDIDANSLSLKTLILKDYLYRTNKLVG